MNMEENIIKNLYEILKEKTSKEDDVIIEYFSRREGEEILINSRLYNREYKIKVVNHISKSEWYISFKENTDESINKIIKIYKNVDSFINDINKVILIQLAQQNANFEAFVSIIKILF